MMLNSQNPPVNPWRSHRLKNVQVFGGNKQAKIQSFAVVPSSLTSRGSVCLYPAVPIGWSPSFAGDSNLGVG